MMRKNIKYIFLKLISLIKALILLTCLLFVMTRTYVHLFRPVLRTKKLICSKYNNPIRNLIFNYNSVVSDPDILNTLPDTCNCSSSKFCYKPFGHIVTGNLDVISNVKLRCVISKGPKYRLPQDNNFEKCFTNIEDSLN